jgi:hypothetical protein
MGGAPIGLLLSSVLPPDHLSGDSKDVVKVGMGLVGTIAAILLGLLVASAKNFYDTQNSELTEMSAKIILLDRVRKFRDCRRRTSLNTHCRPRR